LLALAGVRNPDQPEDLYDARDAYRDAYAGAVRLAEVLNLLVKPKA
jgi:hypothetical protein